MKYLNKQIIGIIIAILSVIILVLTLTTISIKELSFSDIFTSQALIKIENSIKENMYGKEWIIKIKNKYEKLTLTKEANNTYIGKDNYLIKRYKNKLDPNKVSNKLNEFNKLINYVNLNLLLVPSSITINNNKLPLFAYSDNEEEIINSIYQNIKFNKINTTKILKDNRNKYELFYKTDTNWTIYGAYYGYYEYALQNNITPYNISDFDIETVSINFKGNLYQNIEYTRVLDKMNMFYLKNNSYTVEEKNTLYDINALNSDYLYSYYLGEDKDIITITNNTTNDNKELVVIGDSLGNSIIPFLINHYKKIYFINPTLYKNKISDFILNNSNVKDAIIIYNINTLSEQEINNIN